MSDELSRMPCPSCGQRIKYGAEDEGTEAFCPHCDTPVVLSSEEAEELGLAPPPPKPSRGVPKAMMIGIPAAAFVLVFVLIVTMAIQKRGKSATRSTRSTESESETGEEEVVSAGAGSAKSGGRKVALLKGYKRPFEPSKEEKLVFENPTPRKAGEPTQLMGHTIVDAKSGRMQYVVGRLKNHSNKRYFDVEIFFDLLNEKDKKIGEAKDYVGSLSAGETWEFKATIYDRGAKTAKLRKIEHEAE